MNIFDKSFNEIFASVIISTIGGLIAGTILAAQIDKLFLVPGMLIMLPGFLEMRGNISGTFASRLSSGMFLGVIKTNKANTKIIRSNTVASFLLALIVSFALGVLGFLFNAVLFQTYSYEIIIIPLIAGFIANAIEITLTLIATFRLFKQGHDPNNIMGPFITTTGDITSMLSLLIAMAVV